MYRPTRDLFENRRKPGEQANYKKQKILALKAQDKIRQKTAQKYLKYVLKVDYIKRMKT